MIFIPLHPPLSVSSSQIQSTIAQSSLTLQPRQNEPLITLTITHPLSTYITVIQLGDPSTTITSPTPFYQPPTQAAYTNSDATTNITHPADLGGGAIAGIIIASLFIAVALALLAWYIYGDHQKKRRRRRKR